MVLPPVAADEWRARVPWELCGLGWHLCRRPDSTTDPTQGRAHATPDWPRSSQTCIGHVVRKHATRLESRGSGRCTSRALPRASAPGGRQPEVERTRRPSSRPAQSEERRGRRPSKRGR
eukprot:985426-Prymnesium_polylepis.1